MVQTLAKKSMVIGHSLSLIQADFLTDLLRADPKIWSIAVAQTHGIWHRMKHHLIAERLKSCQVECKNIVKFGWSAGDADMGNVAHAGGISEIQYR